MKLFLASVFCIATASAIVVNVCDPEITEANFDKLDVKVDPDPIVVKTGEKVGLHFAIDLLKEVKGGTVKIDIKSGMLPVPCLEVTNNTNSYLSIICRLCNIIVTRPASTTHNILSDRRTQDRIM